MKLTTIDFMSVISKDKSGRCESCLKGLCTEERDLERENMQVCKVCFEADDMATAWDD